MQLSSQTPAGYQKGILLHISGTAFKWAEIFIMSQMVWRKEGHMGCDKLGLCFQLGTLEPSSVPLLDTSLCGSFFSESP